LKNEAKQKPRFLRCVLKKAMDGLFQQPVREDTMIFWKAASGAECTLHGGSVPEDIYQ